MEQIWIREILKYIDLDSYPAAYVFTILFRYGISRYFDVG